MSKLPRTHLLRPSGQQCTQQPTNDEFASMLERLFVGPLAIIHAAPTVLEPPRTLEELRLAIKRLKMKKSSDESGLTAELLKAAPDEFFVQIFEAFNVVLQSGRIPETWKNTTFKMLPKKLRAIQMSDFRPIASSRLFYKVCAYLILGRMEEILNPNNPRNNMAFDQAEDWKNTC